MTTSRSESLALVPLTLGALLRLLALRADARIEGVSGMSSARGEVLSRKVVRIGADGTKRLAVLPNLDDDDAISASVVRSICRSLGLSPADYGA